MNDKMKQVTHMHMKYTVQCALRMEWKDYKPDKDRRKNEYGSQHITEQSLQLEQSATMVHSDQTSVQVVTIFYHQPIFESNNIVKAPVRTTLQYLIVICYNSSIIQRKALLPQ